VFDITKTGKVAGCMITEGVVKRGCGVRLLRDNVVIHQGELSQLKRFKDDVKEVARGYECGLSFAGFQDLREGDVVECYETDEAKGRPHFNPLICHYATAEAAFADMCSRPSPMARRLADTFWPGPLTMVLPRRVTCPVAMLAGAGLETLAVRVPAHPVAHTIIDRAWRAGCRTLRPTVPAASAPPRPRTCWRGWTGGLRR
jgi:hypothetical protein